MVNSRNNLGKLQEEWIDIQRFLIETYPWFQKKDQIPEEAALEKLARCKVNVHNSSCFQEGTCFNPQSPVCGMKEIK